MPNNKGGKKYKRNKQEVKENKNTRFKDEDESQEYAQITKALGNCRFEVLCFDGKTRLATMCGKMRKRVFVNAGEFILVSLRDWQDSKCDIIDKYNANDVQKLKQKKCIPDFIKFEESKNDSDEEVNNDLGFTFTMDMPSDSSEDEQEEMDESEEENSSDDNIDINDI